MHEDRADDAHDRPEVIVAVVLAAGSGSRFAADMHKLHAVIDGRPVGAIAIATAAEAGIGPVVVVAGAAEPPLPGAAVRVVHNPDWQEGQSTSLQAGVRAANELGADAVVVGLADQPFVEAESWRRVAASRSPIAVATYDDEPRNPVRLHRSVWPLLPTEGDVGARGVARMRPDLVERVPCPGSPADIDTVEDLERWQNRSSTNSP
ncbi:MAG: nucleotidyltransferase family protein [Ilumatobacter sp.]|uniref:nucleotidyltransferase family protein n=1 Tax=Ilumatobacter sp. TaxID=1967498 RepID=UPI002624A764|nr:nucleotidyltransferase family protein [Ilumatobacter sp.]MDJ0767736.1 nucleotidyltransferase family protein [Ilumatobacter sp.]